MTGTALDFDGEIEYLKELDRRREDANGARTVSKTVVPSSTLGEPAISNSSCKACALERTTGEEYINHTCRTGGDISGVCCE